MLFVVFTLLFRAGRGDEKQYIAFAINQPVLNAIEPDVVGIVVGEYDIKSVDVNRLVEHGAGMAVKLRSVGCVTQRGKSVCGHYVADVRMNKVERVFMVIAALCRVRASSEERPTVWRIFISAVKFSVCSAFPTQKM